MLDFYDLHTWVPADNSVTGAGVLSDSDSGENDELEWRIAESFASLNKSFIFSSVIVIFTDRYTASVASQR